MKRVDTNVGAVGMAAKPARIDGGAVNALGAPRPANIYFAASDSMSPIMTDAQGSACGGAAMNASTIGEAAYALSVTELAIKPTSGQAANALGVARPAIKGTSGQAATATSVTKSAGWRTTGMVVDARCAAKYALSVTQFWNTELRI